MLENLKKKKNIFSWEMISSSIGVRSFTRLGEPSNRLRAPFGRLHRGVSPVEVSGDPCVTGLCQTRRLRAFVPRDRWEIKERKSGNNGRFANVSELIWLNQRWIFFFFSFFLFQERRRVWLQPLRTRAKREIINGEPRLYWRRTRFNELFTTKSPQWVCPCVLSAFILSLYSQ